MCIRDSPEVELADQDAPGGHAAESTPAAADKKLHGALSLDAHGLARLSVLREGTQLDQGGTYVDLDDLERGPFTAIGGHEATRGSRIVAKRDTDYELWNQLVGQGREPEVERPETT